MDNLEGYITWVKFRVNIIVEDDKEEQITRWREWHKQRQNYVMNPHLKMQEMEDVGTTPAT